MFILKSVDSRMPILLVFPSPEAIILLKTANLPHFCVNNGYLLNCMHKQQDFFGCLAEILGCLGLREAANLEIWPLRPRRGRKGQSSKVGSLEKALGQPKIKARPPKRSRCICIQYNRWFCCIFSQRFMPSCHQSLSSSVGRASGSHAAAPGSILGFGIVF